MKPRKIVKNSRPPRGFYKRSDHALFDHQIIKDSISRLIDAGVATRTELMGITVRWGPEHPEHREWIAYCYLGQREIILTHKMYRMPDWAIDTILWHEYAHALSLGSHRTWRFMKMKRRRRWQWLQEYVVLFLYLFGIYDI